MSPLRKQYMVRFALNKDSAAVAVLSGLGPIPMPRLDEDVFTLRVVAFEHISRHARIWILNIERIERQLALLVDRIRSAVGTNPESEVAKRYRPRIDRITTNAVFNANCERAKAEIEKTLIGLDPEIGRVDNLETVTIDVCQGARELVLLLPLGDQNPGDIAGPLRKVWNDALLDARSELGSRYDRGVIIDLRLVWTGRDASATRHGVADSLVIPAGDLRAQVTGILQSRLRLGH